MSGKRLMERFLEPEDDDGRHNSTETATLMRSVGDHLARLLNTRQGNALIAPDFGMPDVTELVQAFDDEHLRHVEDTLARVISTYEPRLHDVRVRHLPAADTAFAIAFSLSCRISHEGVTLPVIFETVLSADGHIDVKGHA